MRDEFINYISIILTTSTPEPMYLRKLYDTQGDAKLYKFLISENDANQIIMEVKNINKRVEDASSTDDIVGGTKHHKSRRHRKLTRRHRKSTRRHRRKY